MRINWAVTCRYAESDGAVGTIVGAGIDVLHVAAFPARVAIMVALRLAIAPDLLEAGEQHDVTCQVLAPDGEVVLGEDGGAEEPLRLSFIAPPGARQLVPGWLVNPLFAFQVAWLAPDAGTYSIETRTAEDESLIPVHVLLPPEED